MNNQLDVLYQNNSGFSGLNEILAETQAKIKYQIILSSFSLRIFFLILLLFKPRKINENFSNSKVYQGFEVESVLYKKYTESFLKSSMSLQNQPKALIVKSNDEGGSFKGKVKELIL